MSERRADRLRREGRAFRPTLDGQLRLEPRILLAKFHQALGVPGQVRTAAGGSAVEVTTPQGQTFYVAVTKGRITATKMAGGRFAFTVLNSAIDSTLSINPIIDFRQVRSAHTFDDRAVSYTNMLNVGSITIKSGTIGAILGYRDAVLTGPITSLGTSRIDRIAFESIQPGASIFTGGDVNTLNVLNDLTLGGAGTGLVVGRDLNSLTVGGNINVTNNSLFSVGRYVGLSNQLQHGTAPDITGNSAVVTGNLNINTGGKFVINSHIVMPFVIDGSITGAANITINGGVLIVPLPISQTLVVGGTVT